MPDWKYHATSLLAVFLALGIGILIGSAVIGDQAVLSQQSSMLAGLEGDLASLRDSNERFRAEADEANQKLEEARAEAGELFPSLLEGRLQGVEVCLVTEGQVASGSLRERLSQAGAVVTSVTGLQLSVVRWPEKAASMKPGEGTPWSGTAKRLGQQLGEAIALGDEENLTAAGLEEGWLTREGEYGGGSGPLLILTEGREKSDKTAATVLLSLARYWQANRGAVVAVTTAEADVLSPYRQLGIDTVGDLDYPWSEATVIMALARKHRF